MTEGKQRSNSRPSSKKTATKKPRAEKKTPTISPTDDLASEEMSDSSTPVASVETQSEPSVAPQKQTTAFKAEVASELGVENEDPDDIGNRVTAQNPRPVDRSPEQRREVQARPADEYLVQCYYDRAQRQFVGTILEFPELKVTGTSREDVLNAVEARLETHLSQMRQRGEIPGEAIFSRKYPSKLELQVSQTMFRKLDQLSRLEKTDLEQLVLELLTAAVARRLEGRSSAGKSQHQHQQQQNQQRHDHRGGNQGQRHDRGHGQGHRRGGRGNFQQTMDSRENFMEYVRNLEKGGGGRWKK